MDIQFDQKLRSTFALANEKMRWKGTSAIHDRGAYWVAGVLAYFDAASQDGAPNDLAHPIATREQLKEYDPELYSLVHETMAFGGHVDWRPGK